MKKFVAMLLAAMMLLTAMTAIAEENTIMNWAYGAMPLNNGNVGTIYYTAAYYDLEGIVNPTSPEYAHTPPMRSLPSGTAQWKARKSTASTLLPVP